MKSQRIKNNSFSPSKYFQAELNEKLIAFLLLNFCIFCGQTLLFCFDRPVRLSLLSACSLFVVLFSLSAFPLLRGVSDIRRVLGKYCNRILSCFLLFFFIVLGYIVLTSLTVSLPMGWVLGRMGFGADAINVYSLQTSNCALALAVLTWLLQLPAIFSNNDRLAVSA